MEPILAGRPIDNFPVRLLKRLVAMPDEARGPLAIGFDSRTRGFVPADIIALVKDLAARDDVTLTFVFLDCSGTELERRFNETRRRHPLAAGRPVMEGIAAERELLEPLRRWAEIMVDTTAMTSNDLQSHIRELFAPASSESAMTLTLSSFGFARGMPPLADLVFDMRFIDNPHWVPALRELTGQDAPVGEHIERDPAFAEAFARIRDLLLMLLPRYQSRASPMSISPLVVPAGDTVRSIPPNAWPKACVPPDFRPLSGTAILARARRMRSNAIGARHGTDTAGIAQIG